MEKPLLEPHYLGDGVYVHDEGWAISLAVNHHDNKVIYMGTMEILSLIEYAKKVKLIK